MIQELRLKGWRSHLDSELKFAPGTNTLLGVMGAGKSSILSGITFAFFGTFPELQNKKITLDDVIMKRPSQKDKAEVELVFDNNGDTYWVKRVVERGKRSTHAEIWKNDQLLDSGIARTNDIVKDVLKMDYELFIRAIYSEQNGLDNFMSLGKGERMKKVDQILRIDKFEAARQSTSTVANRLRGMIKDKKSMIDSFSSFDSISKKEELEKDLLKLSDERSLLERSVSDFESKRKSQESEVSDISSKMEVLEKLERERSSILGSMESLKKDIEDSGEIDLEKIESEMSQLKELLDSERKSYETMEQDFRERENHRASVIAKRDEIDSALRRISSINGNCPVCEQPMDEEHKKKASKERIDKIGELNSEETRLTEEMEQVKRGMRDKKSGIAEVESRLRSTGRQYDKAQSLVDKKSRLEAYQKKLSLVGDKMSGISVDKDRFKTLQKSLQDTIASHADSKARLQSTLRIIEEKRLQMNEIEARGKMIEDYKKQIVRNEKLVEDFGKLQEALKETQVVLRKQFIESVNISMSQIWEHLYPYEDYANVRLNIIEGDYALEFEDTTGNWIPVEGIASGGERTIALLCMRIAFAHVLAPHLRWLVLDEPTHNLDAQAIDYLAEVLREKITDVVDQVILITHEEKLEQAVTGYLYRLEREKEKNEPTTVVELMRPFEAIAK